MRWEEHLLWHGTSKEAAEAIVSCLKIRIGQVVGAASLKAPLSSGKNTQLFDDYGGLYYPL